MNMLALLTSTVGPFFFRMNLLKLITLDFVKINKRKQLT